MNFNPDPSKQAQKVIFSQKFFFFFFKKNLAIHHYFSWTLKFCNLHLRNILVLYLTSNWKSSENADIKNQQNHRTFTKITKPFIPRSALITIYKAFIRPYLGYGDIIYNEASNASFHHQLELFQYNVCLAITGVLRTRFGIPLASALVHKTMLFLQDLYSNIVSQQNFARNVDKVPLVKIKHNFFKNSLFPSTINEWNKLSQGL